MWRDKYWILPLMAGISGTEASESSADTIKKNSPPQKCNDSTNFNGNGKKKCDSTSCVRKISEMQTTHCQSNGFVLIYTSRIICLNCNYCNFINLTQKSCNSCIFSSNVIKIISRLNVGNNVSSQNRYERDLCNA